jgi:transposase InsO family protein
MNLESAYYTPAEPGSFSSVNNLKRQFVKLSRKDVNKFLSRQDAYTLHRDIVRKFPRRKTSAFGINDLWQADLVDLSSLMRYNNGYRYLLTAIDVLTKYGRVTMLRNKNAATVTEAFSDMIGDVKPRLLQTDKGTEFLNAQFQKMLADNGIKHYTSENDDIKASIVERWHRTLLAKLYRYFTYKNTYRYVDVIQDIVASYNATYHSTIKMAPVDVTVHNESVIREALLSHSPKKTKPKFNVGDAVRISGTKQRIPAKGYRDKWTEEVFNITKILNTNPITYVIADYNGEELKGKFYTPELQKVIKDVYRVEKVLKTRKVTGGKKQYYVKWLGYDDTFNSWVDNINA